MADNDCDMDTAVEWIEYNTMRALPYFPNAPLVLEVDTSELVEFYLQD